ncbi:hypothetical protein TH3_14425 [Thalassospira xiamenensis M-5 = DSM 17429]|uniref:Uncharacterized protein n=1 Tax=Thalassospira xiamenensis M-5 = DSM 17429 TaxID=1123366 RepID=A0AB72UFI3_9PROT|nr:hypothetical protein TH3_14425 [Thalassospira xiamenensis M-5 = DSM 17429]
MQPANTTALSVSETVRSLNSGSKGKAGGMVTFRTRLRLMGSGWKAGEAVAAHATGGGGVADVHDPSVLYSQALSSPRHLLIDVCTPLPLSAG